MGVCRSVGELGGAGQQGTERPNCWESCYVDIALFRIIVGREKRTDDKQEVCGKGGVMTERRAEGHEWGGGHRSRMRVGSW